MTRKLLLSYLLFLPFLSFSTGKESLPSVWIIKDSVSEKIHQDSVKLVFKIEDAYNQLMLNQHVTVVQMKVAGKTRKFTISDKNRAFKLTLSKGKHSMSFFINANFEELHFERQLVGGHYYEIGLNFEGSSNSGRQIILEKPVIYLYSETGQDFNLKIKTDAELHFTYPAYTDEWKGKATRDGTIQMNGTNYPYLFWDAQLSAERLKPDWQNADQIIGDQTTVYLSTCLDHLGFNPKEKTDFITYWGPRIQKMKYARILWLQNEAVNGIASIDITGGFTQNRVYILFMETTDLTDETLPLKLTNLKPVDRTNNYLIEWGGIEIQSNL